MESGLCEQWPKTHEGKTISNFKQPRGQLKGQNDSVLAGFQVLAKCIYNDYFVSGEDKYGQSRFLYIYSMLAIQFRKAQEVLSDLLLSYCPRDR